MAGIRYITLSKEEKRREIKQKLIDGPLEVEPKGARMDEVHQQPADPRRYFALSGAKI